jgi:cystathionine beta-lyase/cystathionine gamma-synthase
MSHASVPSQIREELGITENLMRLSIGIESLDDLVADLQQAMEGSQHLD